ncbi:hypothetical protein niasHT_022610 [Heterodera trifolii]|uniref:DDE-1 domain-containing protein n=1 Tax=Heterodera trifolii TaxID=157864 RepID=A0ABD2JRJ5_9BILA
MTRRDFDAAGFRRGGILTARLFSYTHVYAVDETAVWLDSGGGTCVAEKGSKTVTVLNTGHEKARVTVLLTARSDGTKMRPFVLLPRKRPVPNIIDRFRKTLVLSWCGRTWMDNDLTTEYLEKIFGNFHFGARLLVWDSFRCHISEDTKKTLRRWPFTLRSFRVAPPNTFRRQMSADGAIPNGLALLKQRRQEEEVLKMVEEIDLGEDESDEEIDVELIALKNRRTLDYGGQYVGRDYGLRKKSARDPQAVD